MNPLTNVRNITKLNEREISLGVSDGSSWHAEYKDSAWVFIGGLDFLLTEGDILCVFSQYGEIVNVNLVRDKKTGKSKGYCFLCYEDQRSTNLAVDNFNGIKITGRTIRVDHVSNYRIPKEDKDADLETKLLRDVGCAPEVQRQVVSIIEREREESKNAVREVVKKESSDFKNAATSSSYGNERDERRITEESLKNERKKNDGERKRRKELKESRSSRPRRSRSPQPRDSSSSSSEQSEAGERRRRDRKKSSKHSNDHRRSRKSKRSAKKS